MGSVSNGHGGTIVTLLVSISNRHEFWHVRLLTLYGWAFVSLSPRHNCKIVVAGEPPLRPLMRNGMNIRFVLVVTLWIAICGKVTPALAGKPIGPAAIAQVDAIFAEESRQHPIGSITVGIVSGVDLVWTRSYGFADMEARTLATRNTMYRIGSVTKQFTGIMLLQLAAARKVRLSGPVEKYLPEVAEIQRPFLMLFSGPPKPTLLQIATHQAGLSLEPDSNVYMTGPVDSWDEITRSALPHVRYESKPGEKFSYSNIGYAILGAALSRAAAEPYTDYLRRHILGPLGMAHTTFEPDGNALRVLAKGYDVKNGKGDSSAAAKELASGRGYKVPNGGLFSTVDDLAKVVSFEFGQGPSVVLDPQTVHENFSRVYPTPNGNEYAVP
jgi:CubicO group peptidase (beta-lactamase class C family)